MDELRGRFAAIDRIAAPDLWTEIERRADVLGAAQATRPVDRGEPAWRAAPATRPAPALGGRSLVVALILLAALIVALIGALIAGSVRPDEIRTTVVPSQVATVPVPKAAIAPGPRPGAGSWTTAGQMTADAYLQAATLLADGTVLVTGGRDDAVTTSRSMANAELFDAATGTWTPVATMRAGRSVHTATRLADGRVLVAGGFDDWAALATAEIYDPATGTWTPTGSMIEGRGYHTATLLPDGRVLVAGGRSNNSSTGLAMSSAELYDPTTGTWTETGTMSRHRTSHTATLLPDGSVLVAGAGLVGMRVDVADTAELYDPTTGTWTPTGSMTAPRAGHGAVLLPTGDVLVAGGNDSIAGAFDVGTGRALRSAELYDPTTGGWTATGEMHHPHVLSTATLLGDGMVLVAAGRLGDGSASSGTSSFDTGNGSTSAETYDSTTRTWTEAAGLDQQRELQIAVALPDGRVVIAGGLTAGTALASTEVYDPSADR